MKSHVELTKRQLQVLPYLLACPTYEEAVNKLKYSTTKAADTLVSLLSHSNPTIQRGVAQRGVANDLLNHVAKFIELHEIEERIQFLEAKVKS